MIKLSWKIWLLIIILIASIISIFNFQFIFTRGVVVKDIETNSSVVEAGLKTGYIINTLNGNAVNDEKQYLIEMQKIFDKTNESKKIVLGTDNGQIIFFSNEIPKISVSNIPLTKIKTGLDLQGGARALIKPEGTLNSDEINILIETTDNRFNVYGISDIAIRPATDLSGQQFILIEMAGATPKELEKLISEQGKFEAKIGNETVFIGGIRADTGKKDITYVCRDDASCSGIQACQASGNGWYCNYRFVVHLSEEAAERHAQITSTIPINTTNPKYLEKQIDFYVDDTLTTSLFISDNLKGKKTTQIEIQGSGFGADRNSAIKDAQESMKHMQTLLITGSLPYKLNVVKLDRVSPILGEKFNSTILLTGVICFIAVGIIIAVRYRNFKASILMLFINFTEIIIILGIAALIKWNLDLPSIVGILVRSE